ncbi:hypothetical protein C8Q72DRAFT_230592 [Fomitopsis betulina]|nr:hypothetical protein C8Q72DRAFT_230592 [Fomitopsis betulina]
MDQLCCSQRPSSRWPHTGITRGGGAFARLLARSPNRSVWNAGAVLELEHSVRRTHIGSKPRGVARSCKPGCNAFVDVQALRNDLVNVDISIQKTYCSFRCGMHDRDRLAMDREPESQRRVNRTRPLTPAIIEWLEWVRRRVEWSRGFGRRSPVCTLSAVWSNLLSSTSFGRNASSSLVRCVPIAMQTLPSCARLTCTPIQRASVLLESGARCMLLCAQIREREPPPVSVLIRPHRLYAIKNVCFSVTCLSHFFAHDLASHDRFESCVVAVITKPGTPVSQCIVFGHV